MMPPRLLGLGRPAPMMGAGRGECTASPALSGPFGRAPIADGATHHPVAELCCTSEGQLGPFSQAQGPRDLRHPKSAGRNFPPSTTEPMNLCNLAISQS